MQTAETHPQSRISQRLLLSKHQDGRLLASQASASPSSLKLWAIEPEMRRLTCNFTSTLATRTAALCSP